MVSGGVGGNFLVGAREGGGGGAGGGGGGGGGLARRAHRITNRVLPVARVERCHALMTEYTLVAYLQSVPSPGQQST